MPRDPYDGRHPYPISQPGPGPALTLEGPPRRVRDIVDGHPPPLPGQPGSPGQPGPFPGRPGGGGQPLLPRVARDVDGHPWHPYPRQPQPPFPDGQPLVARVARQTNVDEDIHGGSDDRQRRQTDSDENVPPLPEPMP